MEIAIYRDKPIFSEDRKLPASVYNLAHQLIARSRSGVVFVPIRSLQMLAILDPDEIVFVDSQFRNVAESAWRLFHPQQRVSLDEPVAFTLEIYHHDGIEKINRLLSEFPKSMRELADKDQVDGPAKILKFQRDQG